MNALDFEEPWLGASAALALVLFAFWRAIEGRRVGGTPAAASAAAERLGGRREARVDPPRLVAAAGLLALCAALARPVERVREPVEARGRDVVLVVDVSSSMGERDLDGERTRLEVARAALRRFVAARPVDRFALVRFARFPDLVVPLTPDHASVLAAVDGLALVEGDGAEDVTGIGLALARAARLSGDGAARVVVLVTDGIDNVANGRAGEISPTDAARLAHAAGVRVHALGTGAAAGAGLDDLRRVAEHCGGLYAPAGDAAAMTSVLDAIDQFESTLWAAPSERVHERFHGFVAAALALLVLARLLRAGPYEVLP